MALDEFLEESWSLSKNVRGCWFVVRQRGHAVSPILDHDLYAWNGAVVRGVGSLATRPERRCAEWAARILEQVLQLLMSKGSAACVSFQTRTDSIFMVRFASKLEIRHGTQNADRLPSYR